MPQDVDRAILANRANVLFRSGPVDDAIAAHCELLARYPDLADSWYNLALLQYRSRNMQSAVASCRQALSLGINGPEEVHLQLGVIFSDGLGDSDRAREHLDAALSINPNYAPAWLNLGNLHEDRGERGDAERAYRNALAIVPGDPLGLARLAGLRTEVTSDDPILGDLNTALTRSDLSMLDRADLGFALGRLLDLAGDYGAAIATYAAANYASATLAAAQGRRYHRRAEELRIDRIIAAWATPSDRISPASDDTPLFLCGMFRSGSTLIETILSSHRRLTAGGELATIPALVRLELPGFPEEAAAATPERLEKLRLLYLAETASHRLPGTRLIDKQPTNIFHVGLLKSLFPDAKFVFTKRAMPDNCLSVFFLHADPALSYATDLSDIAHHYRQCERLAAHWKNLYSADIYEADYDRLVAAPRDEMGRLFDFCELEWQDELLNFPHRSGTIRTASNWQVRQPLHGRSSGRWLHYAPYLGHVHDFYQPDGKA